MPTSAATMCTSRSPTRTVVVVVMMMVLVMVLVMVMVMVLVMVVVVMVVVVMMVMVQEVYSPLTEWWRHPVLKQVQFYYLTCVLKHQYSNLVLGRGQR